MKNILRKENHVIRWIMLISLSLTCEACIFSHHASNDIKIKMDKCNLTSIDPTMLTRFTSLETLTLRFNSLTTFPDLSPIGNTLMAFWAGNNEIDEIKTDKLKPLTKLEVLNLDNNRLATFPDLSPVGNTLRILQLPRNQISHVSKDALIPLTRLEHLSLQNNRLTIFPDLSPIGSTLTILLLQTNQLYQINDDAFLSLIRLEILKLNGNMNLIHFPHPVDGLSSIKHLTIRDTGISHLAPILHENIAALELIVKKSVDVCSCENTWLKQEGPNMATFQYDDKICGSKLWSSMTIDDMIAKCMEEERQKSQKNAVFTSVTTTSVKLFLLNAYVSGYYEEDCAVKCMDTPGCVSFYWRQLNDPLGECVIIAPGSSISGSAIPNGNSDVWTYFRLEKHPY